MSIGPFVIGECHSNLEKVMPLLLALRLRDRPYSCYANLDFDGPSQDTEGTCFLKELATSLNFVRSGGCFVQMIVHYGECYPLGKDEAEKKGRVIVEELLKSLQVEGEAFSCEFECIDEGSELFKLIIKSE